MLVTKTLCEGPAGEMSGYNIVKLFPLVQTAPLLDSIGTTLLQSRICPLKFACDIAGR